MSECEEMKSPPRPPSALEKGRASVLFMAHQWWKSEGKPFEDQEIVPDQFHNPRTMLLRCIAGMFREHGSALYDLYPRSALIKKPRAT